MNIADQEIFNQAIALAKQGQKPEANSMLKFLLQTNPLDANLLLWTAFTNTDLTEASNLIDRANLLNPANSLLPEMRAWLAKENAKAPAMPTPTRLFQTDQSEQAYQSQANAQLKLRYQSGLRQRQIKTLNQIELLEEQRELLFVKNQGKLDWLYRIVAIGTFLLLISAFLPYINLQLAGRPADISSIDIQQKLPYLSFQDGYGGLVSLLNSLFLISLLVIGYANKKNFMIFWLLMGSIFLEISLFGGMLLFSYGNIKDYLDTATYYVKGTLNGSVGWRVSLGITGSLLIFMDLL